MKNHYDFSKGERGKYAKRIATDAILVLLEDDVAAFFEDAESVNNALRRYLQDHPTSPQGTTIPST